MSRIAARPGARGAVAQSVPHDVCFMSAALAHGEGALGTTAPNPCVGALVVRDGRVIGRGVTQPGGRPHAEVMALIQAADAARGATLYVTLEPCAERSDPRFGLSCTDAILAAGIARVVVAADDPSPMAGGRCYDRLGFAGVALTRGVCADKARRINLGHINRMNERRPMVTLKLAQTGDGFAADGAGARRLLITGAPANRLVQLMRSRHDAIMVGVGTVRADDPLLTVRLDALPVRRPIRMVLDTEFALPPGARLLRSIAAAPVWVAGAVDAPPDRAAVLRDAGATVLQVPRGADGRADLRAVLAAFADRGITRVLSEGGPTVAAALLAADLVDEVVLFTGAHALGEAGLPALSAAAHRRLQDAAAFQPPRICHVGRDRLARYERTLDCSPA